jgi:hypothetical protein
MGLTTLAAVLAPVRCRWAMIPVQRAPVLLLLWSAAALFLLRGGDATVTAATDAEVSSIGSSSRDGPGTLVMFVADDLGWNDVGWKNTAMRTPTIDALRSQGVELVDYYVHQVCSH